jgi:DegV family protein with EDD domain
MKKTAILTDSTAYLPADQMEKCGISSVPLAVIWGEETFDDGVTITPEQFYSRLKTAKVMPSTSQPSVGKMQEAMNTLLSQDCDVLGIFISSKLSGTMESAMQARALLPKGSKVEIVDSGSTTLGMGFLVMAVARAAADGASFTECRAIAEKLRANIGVYFMVDTLEFLYRGGRIGGGQRFLGTALNMKPILYINNGKLESLEKVRTKGKALDRMIDIVAEKCAGKSPIWMSAVHANAPDEAQITLEKIKARLNPEESFLAELSPVIGTHTGPGTVSLSYLTGM